MNQKTKNIISIILPITTIFIIALTLRTQPTGLVVYENKTLYRINGSITLTLEEKIPIDSYIRIKIDDYIIKINIIDFLEMSETQSVSEHAQEPLVLDESGKNYKIIEEDNKELIIANNTYTIDLHSLGITLSFEKGKHKIEIEMIHKDSILHTNEKIIEI